MRILKVSLISAAAIVMVAGGIALLNSIVSEEPAEFTYSFYDRPQNSADREAIARYTGDSSQVSLDTARLLGSDELGNQYLAVRDDVRSCLVVVHSAEASSFGCSYRERDTEVVRWLKIGDENGDRLAIIVPDGYSIDAIRGTKLVTGPNLVVLQSSPEGEVVKIPGLGGHKTLIVDTSGG